MRKKIVFLVFAALIIFAFQPDCCYAAGKIGVGFSSVSLTNLTATGAQLVMTPYDFISLKGRVYASIQQNTDTSTYNYIGGDISCFYNFPAVQNTKIIPQLGCSFGSTSYWRYHDPRNLNNYSFKLLLAWEWFIQDYFSLNLVWPFLDARWSYENGILDSSQILYFGSTITGGITFYFQ